ncbi:hypothetical protein BpHYR1_038182 [Brachionus plicatilis]|uniref:C-type lectin domain-containing protein n=1 Tax=Brachionus plicatilis TaxID=10195 RepID=A0A3M7RAH7_BRAPC|nr:hypothetical protein BpHYR1_038182 [Brachionus plicatilis]
MKKIDFLFKYLTITFSLAILLRFEFIEQNGMINHILKSGLADTSINEIKLNQERKEKENLENFFLKIYTENNDCFNNTTELFNNTCKNGNSKCIQNNNFRFDSKILWRCLMIFNDKTTWKDADATCSAQNASLFEAKKAYSKNFLDSLVKALNIKEGIYFISYGKSESKYNWFWNFDLKNKKWSHEEECTELVVSSDKRYFGKYEDYSCNLSKRKFICQKKLQNYSQNIQDFIFENFNNLNLSKVLLQELEKLTRDQSFTKTTNLKNQQKHLQIIIENIIKFNQVDLELFTLKFDILNNILEAEPFIFKKEPNLSIKLLYVIEDLTKQISSNKLSPYKYLGSNFMITVNDYPLLNRNDSNNLNYLPISQEFYRNYEISGFSRNAIKLKNKELMFPSEFNSLVNSLKTRISIIYFKNSKLFQSDKFLLSNPIINVMFFVISNMSSIFISNTIEYQTNLKKKELIDRKSIKCVSWNFNDAKGAWSDKNCHFLLNDPLRDIYKCSCNHTSIVGLAYDHIAHVEKLRASKTLNNIGLMFSTFCLLATLISNITFRKINKSVQTKIHSKDKP